MNDRRYFERIAVKIPLRYQNPLNGTEDVAQTLNISANGICFVTSGYIPMENNLKMWLDIPDHHEPLAVEGEVSWIRPERKGNYKQVGIHLIHEKLIGLARTLWLKENLKAQPNLE